MQLDQWQIACPPNAGVYLLAGDRFSSGVQAPCCDYMYVGPMWEHLTRYLDLFNSLAQPSILSTSCVSTHTRVVHYTGCYDWQESSHLFKSW